MTKRLRTGRSRAQTQGRKAEIYSTLKDNITFFELRPGEALNETKLAGDLGVSRTLLREVIQRLVGDGLLTAVPGQGVYVEGIDLVGFKSVFEIRAHLEKLAGHLAAERVGDEHLAEIRQIIAGGEAALARGDFREMARLDWRFHAAIGDATRNPTLARFLLRLLGPFIRLWYIAMSDFRQIGDPVGDWRRTLDALERRSTADAAKALAMHMTTAPTVLLPVFAPTIDLEVP